MTRRIFFLASIKIFSGLLYFFSLQLNAEHNFAIGEEVIKPINYPKFSLSGEYNFMRHVAILGYSDFNVKASNNYGAALSFETGLYKYLNAGAIISSSFLSPKEDNEPFYLRFSLFAKPVFSFLDCLSIYGRFGGGLSVGAYGNVLTHLTGLSRGQSADMASMLGNSQDYKYVLFPGLNGSATIGLEYFPISRFGIGIEWGIRANIFYFRQENVREGSIDGETGEVYVLKGPKALFSVIYETPLMLTFHVIL
jgi:hypothetical protein